MCYKHWIMFITHKYELKIVTENLTQKLNVNQQKRYAVV